jgi:hypothetical protein
VQGKILTYKNPAFEKNRGTISFLERRERLLVEDEWKTRQLLSAKDCDGQSDADIQWRRPLESAP